MVCTGLVMYVSALELQLVQKHLMNFPNMPHANKGGSRAHSQAAYSFLEWEMDGDTGRKSPYESAVIKQDPYCGVKKTSIKL